MEGCAIYDAGMLDLQQCLTLGHTNLRYLGPFFTSFPQLAQAQKNGTPLPGTGGVPPIATTSRATTVLPNFVG